MGERIDSVDVMPESFLEAVDRLRLHTEAGNLRFREMLSKHAITHEFLTSQLMPSLSFSNIKNMRKCIAKVPPSLPQPLASFIFIETGIDITTLQCLSAFKELNFDIQFALDVLTHNTSFDDLQTHELNDLFFEIHECRTTAEDIEEPDYELDLRIGFDRSRLTFRAIDLQPIDNEIAGETAKLPGEERSSYAGWFKLRLANRTPLSWFFDPEAEGGVLEGRIDVPKLARVQTKAESSLHAEITAKRDALKVRIVDEEGRKASKSLSDRHRDKMCAAVARKSFMGAADEYLIHRVCLITSS